MFELCRELEQVLPETRFFVYSRGPIVLPSTSICWTTRIEPSTVASKMPRLLWLKLRCGVLCKQDHLDVFWAAGSLLPSLPQQVKTVLTVYDVNHHVVPRTMPVANLWSYRLFFDRDVRRADTVLTISEGTAARLYKYVGRSADAVVRPSVSDAFRPCTESDIQERLDRYRIRRPYILAVATWEPRKNLELLVRTYLELKRDGLLPQYQLVLVGGQGWKDARLRILVQEAVRDLVRPLGFIDDYDLPALYAGAEVFVYPSIYEGFGIPVLEACRCQTKVVATDLPEIREVGCDGVIYVAPDAQGLRDGILSAVKSERRTRQTGDVASWKDGAKKMASIFLAGRACSTCE